MSQPRLTDQPQEIREGENLDAAAVGAWLRDQLGDLQGDPEIRQFPSGASNLTYLLEFPGTALILRRPPFGRKAKSAHDMGREFRVLSALRQVYPYCPQPLAHCTDEGVIGSEFYVMERVEGIILRKEMPEELGFSDADHGQLCRELLDRFVDLHAVDWKAAGLEDFGRPDGYVRRQIEGWSKRYVDARTPDSPEFTAVMEWLADKMPDHETGASVIHNDYRFDNVIFDPRNPLRIIGVLDWEMATIGDPLMDLGNMLAYWVEASDPPPVQMMRMQPSHLPGMLTRRECVEYYAERSGRNVEAFDFYYVYGLFRLAVIMQQIYYRYFHGQTKDKRFASFIHLIGLIEKLCTAQIEQSDL